MNDSTTITESEILSELVGPDQPGLPPEFAQSILDMRFNQRAVCRMNDLAEKNRNGTITDQERDILERYVRVGNFLNLLQAKARVSLTNTNSKSTANE